MPSILLLSAGACGEGNVGDHLFDSSGAATAQSGASSSGGSAVALGGSAQGGGNGEVPVSGKPSSGSDGGNGASGGVASGGAAGSVTESGTGGATQGEAGSDAGGAGGGDECAVAAVVTSAVFEQLFPAKTRDAFYTYEGFLSAAQAYPDFGTQGDCDTRKRDIAAFFANVARQTSRLHYVEQINKTTACASTVESAPCAPGKKYYGRGPMQLSWNYNYLAASKCLGLGSSLLEQPDEVAVDAVVAWRTGLWFWNNGGANRCQDQARACASPPDTTSCDSPHGAMISGRGFGATIDLVNGAVECGEEQDDATRNAVRERVCYFRQFVEILGTTTGPGQLSCTPGEITCP